MPVRILFRVLFAALLVCTLIIVMTKTTVPPVALAGRGVYDSLKMQLSGVKKARLSMLDEACVSWRGYTGRYESYTMDLNAPVPGQDTIVRLPLSQVSIVILTWDRGSRFTVTLAKMLYSIEVRHNS